MKKWDDDLERLTLMLPARLLAWIEDEAERRLSNKSTIVRQILDAECKRAQRTQNGEVQVEA